MSNGTVKTRWKVSGIKGMPSKVFLFYRLQRSHYNFVNLGTSRPSLPSSTGSFLTNGTASYFDPFLTEEINRSICPKNPTWKFHANDKRSLSRKKIMQNVLKVFTIPLPGRKKIVQRVSREKTHTDGQKKKSKNKLYRQTRSLLKASTKNMKK